MVPKGRKGCSRDGENCMWKSLMCSMVVNGMVPMLQFVLPPLSTPGQTRERAKIHGGENSRMYLMRFICKTPHDIPGALPIVQTFHPQSPSSISSPFK